MRRRQILGWLAAAPVGGVLAGCGEPMRVLDAGLGDGDAGPGVDAAAAADGGVCAPSQADALGPFFEDGAPMRMVIAAPDEPGERLLVQGALLDASDCGRGRSGYTVDVWQADADGRYHRAADTDYRLRGRVTTGADGSFALETILPGSYETAAGPRPKHLHVRIWDPEGFDRLVTQVYFEGDPFLAPNDGCPPPGCRSDDRARILRLDPARVGGRDGFRAALRLVV